MLSVLEFVGYFPQKGGVLFPLTTPVPYIPGSETPPSLLSLLAPPKPSGPTPLISVRFQAVRRNRCNTVTKILSD